MFEELEREREKCRVYHGLQTSEVSESMNEDVPFQPWMKSGRERWRNGGSLWTKEKNGAETSKKYGEE